MSTNFPTTGIDSFPTHATSDVIQASFDNNEQDAIVALETKVGINGSAISSTHDYKLSGVTGSDKASSLTGTENLSNKTLVSPKINLGSDATGDTYYNGGSGVLTRLPKGSDTQVLTLASGVPSWATPAAVVNASSSVKGVVEIATAAEITAGTATGGTGAILAMSPDQLALSSPTFSAINLTNIPKTVLNSYSIAVMTAQLAVGSGSTIETNVIAATAVAGGSLSAGRAIRYEGYFHYTGINNSASITFKIYYGASSVLTITLGAQSSVSYGYFVITVAYVGASSQYISGYAQAGTGGGGVANIIATTDYSTTSAVDSSASQNVKITVTGSASNTLTVETVNGATIHLI